MQNDDSLSLQNITKEPEIDCSSTAVQNIIRKQFKLKTGGKNGTIKS